VNEEKIQELRNELNLLEKMVASGKELTAAENDHYVSCRCYANTPEDEGYCENSNLDLESCVDVSNRCHWGPLEVEECAIGPCECYANGRSNEHFCESGALGPEECLSDSRCHGGPKEYLQCNHYNEN